MSRPEVDNVPDLFQMVNETLIPKRIQGIKEASEHSTVSGQMERSETSSKIANTEPRPVSTSLAVAKRVEASEGPERTGHKPLMRNPSADRPSRQAVLPATPFIAAPSVLERTESQLAARDIPKDEFDGSTYEPEKDRTRLKAQLIRVRELMRDGVWRSLAEISEGTGDPESSVSARLRDLRKPKFGLWTVDRRRRTNGLWEYRLGGKGL